MKWNRATPATVTEYENEDQRLGEFCLVPLLPQPHRREVGTEPRQREHEERAHADVARGFGERRDADGEVDERGDRGRDRFDAIDRNRGEYRVHQVYCRGSLETEASGT